MPAPFVPANNTAKIVTVFESVSGKRVTIGSCWVGGEAWDNLTLANLLDKYEDAWAELMPGNYASNLRVVRFEAYDMEVEGGSYASLDIAGSALAGTRAGTPEALNVAMSVTFRTSSRGRSYRGRLYHPGLVAGDRASDRTWQSSIADAMGDVYGAVALAVHTDLPLVYQAVVSKMQDGDWLTNAVVTPIVSWVGRIPVATQRLRVSV